MPRIPEANLLNALKSNQKGSLKQIMEAWYARLFNFANGYLKNDEWSKEVLQDVFLQLWDHREQLYQDTSLKAYLFTITRNRCIDVIRKERASLQFQKDKKDEYVRLKNSYNALHDPILDEIFTKEFQSGIDKIIGSLPDQCRLIFILSREKGLKNREISDQLGLSLKTVESHITKALKTIREELEHKFPETFHLLFLFWNSLGECATI
ncbi:RNA polymerase sigma-70 factor [Mangrovibacterium lignilyticum]|uniref:RNA polymerase sigma-70 factor n=1 Tax=Mangrovibacterium lignilyticum TaxID=2668052 RepID=UPI0013D09B18|nr:RNA polymerase sigma-70 factor [Mangrovibacterium lignilyticum]